MTVKIREQERKAPAWVRDALADSPAPKAIVDALLDRAELASLWDTLPDRKIVALLPELIGLAGSGAALAWSQQWTPREQAAKAKRVAKLARELNRELADFAPLDPFGVHQLAPHHDARAHAVLVALPPMASRRRDADSLLVRLAGMADRFEPSGTPFRSGRADAKMTAFVRKIAGLFPNTPSGRAFVAGIVNAITGAEWDGERVRKSLSGKAAAITRKTKAT